jgi:hypothetical protein
VFAPALGDFGTTFSAGAVRGGSCCAIAVLVPEIRATAAAANSHWVMFI